MNYDSRISTTQQGNSEWRTTASRLNAANGPVHLVLPLKGVEAWDRENEVAHAPGDLAAFFETLRAALSDHMATTVTNCHINDPAFVEGTLMAFDTWLATGVVGRPR